MGLLFKAKPITGSGTAGNLLNFGKIAAVEYDGYAVTPADGTDLPNGPCDAIYCTAGGDVNAQMVRTNNEGNVTQMAATVLKTLATGEIMPIQLSRILSTSTTATGIFALYRK